MKDFLYRTIEETAEVIDEDGDKVAVRAWRTRNSNGHRSIGISFGNQCIEFNFGGDYEQHAKMLRDMLGKVIDNPCELPTMDGL